MTIHHFWAQSGPFASNIFFRKLANEPCFFYSCLSTCQKGNSDINLLVKYWWFKNTKILFAFTLELDFSQACSFVRMLMKHKKFDFTQIPRKTNDVILLKSPKTMFLGHFWPFLPDGDFFQKNQQNVTHNYIWIPNIMLSFRKN